MRRLNAAIALGLSLWLGLALPLLAKRVHPAIVRNLAFPAHANVPFVSYRIELEIGTSAVEQLRIDLPKTIRVTSGIVIEDPNGIVIPSTVTYQGQQAIISFAQPLVPSSKISIDLNGIKNSLRTSRTINLPMYAKEPGQAQLIQFDTAHIRLSTP